MEDIELTKFVVSFLPKKIMFLFHTTIGHMIKKKATSPTNLNDADFVVGAPCERGWFDVMHLMSLRSHILFRIPVEYLNIVKCCSKGVD